MKIFIFILINTILFSKNATYLSDSSDIKDSTISKTNLDSSVTINDNNQIILIENKALSDSLNIINESDIFYEQLLESKLTFVDAIMYDVTLDTIEAEIQFQALFR